MSSCQNHPWLLHSENRTVSYRSSRTALRCPFPPAPQVKSSGRSCQWGPRVTPGVMAVSGVLSVLLRARHALADSLHHHHASSPRKGSKVPSLSLNVPLTWHPSTATHVAKKLSFLASVFSPFLCRCSGESVAVAGNTHFSVSHVHFLPQVPGGKLVLTDPFPKEVSSREKAPCLSRLEFQGGNNLG